MTTVVAVEHKDGVTFACDSRISGWALSDGWVEKVVKNGILTFGTAGYLRAIQVLAFANLPVPPEGNEKVIDRYVVLELVPAIKAAFDDDGDEGKETLKGSIFIAAVRGRAYEISYDGAITRNPDGHYAIGSGYGFALGALSAGAKADEAVKIASRYDSGTNNDVHVTEVTS